MKRFRNIALALVVISFFLVVAVCTFYNINMAKVSNDNTLKEVTIKAGSINSIANTLKENNLLNEEQLKDLKDVYSVFAEFDEEKESPDEESKEVVENESE